MSKSEKKKRAAILREAVETHKNRDLMVRENKARLAAEEGAEETRRHRYPVYPQLARRRLSRRRGW